MDIVISCIMHTSNFTTLQQECYDIRMLSTSKLNIYKLQTRYSCCFHDVIAIILKAFTWLMTITFRNLFYLHWTGVTLCFILHDRHLLVFKHSIINILHVRDIDYKYTSILFSISFQVHASAPRNAPWQDRRTF
jgi:hypothetical protein